MEKLRDSEDVKEAVSLVGHASRKGNQAAPGDRDYLKALLLSCRKFSRLDGLLHELRCPVRQLKEALGVIPPPIGLSETRFFELAVDWARQDQQQAGHLSAPVIVDVEHWLKALCESSDVGLRQLLQEYGITIERINQAVRSVNGQQAPRTFLFWGKELLEVVVFVLTFLIIIKSVFGELRLIPSESMVPGLKIDDRLVIERIMRWTRPYQRGDILVFYPPMTHLGRDPWSVFMRITGFSGLMYKKEDNVDVAYIKRLIGLPGDTVDVRPGDGVYVNGQKLDEPYVNEIATTCTMMRPEPSCQPVKVPEGSFYMMGDNRNLSLDSRYWGFARQDRVIGRAVFRIWPMNRVGTLSTPPYQK